MGTDSVVSIEFDLTNADMEYFRGRLAKAREALGDKDEAAIIAGAKALADKSSGGGAPAFLTPRIETLRKFIAMLEDADWNLEGNDRQHVLNALTYFADPDDIVPDSIPGIGLLDDAIMIDLAAMELAPELEAYAEFCVNREELKDGVEDAMPIGEYRNILQSRMRRQRRRAARRGGGRGYTLFGNF